jgi:hypothetical protein
VRVELNSKTRSLRVVVVKAAFRSMDGFGGADVMNYVGFRAPLGRLPAGEYQVRIEERTDIHRDPGDPDPKKGEPKLDREFAFTVR